MTTELPEGLQKALEIVGGQRWPEGDEDGLRRISTAWSDISAAIDKLEAAVDRSANDIGTTMRGEFSDAYGQYVTDTLRPMLRDLRAKTDHHSELAKNTAADIQYAKISIIAQLVIVAATLAFSWLPGIGQAITAAAAATARAVIAAIFRTVLQNIIAGAAAGVALESGLDAAIQGMQMLTGVRTDWNEEFTKGAAVGGALGGAMGGTVYGALRGVGGFARGGIGDVSDSAADDVTNSLAKGVDDGVVRGPSAEGAEGVLGQGAKDFLDTTGGKLGFDAANIVGQGGAGLAADGATNSALGSEEWNPFSFTASMADGFEKRGDGTNSSYGGGNGDGGTDTSGLDGLRNVDDVDTDLPAAKDTPKTIGAPEDSGGTETQGVDDARGAGNESPWTAEESDGATLHDGASGRSRLSGTTLGATEAPRNTSALGSDGVNQRNSEVNNSAGDQGATARAPRAGSSGSGDDLPHEESTETGTNRDRWDGTSGSQDRSGNASTTPITDARTAGSGEVAGNDSSVVGSQHDNPAENSQRSHGTNPDNTTNRDSANRDSAVQEDIAREAPTQNNTTQNNTGWDSTGADASGRNEFDGWDESGLRSEIPPDNGTQRNSEDVTWQNDNGSTGTNSTASLTSAGQHDPAEQPPPAQEQSTVPDETTRTAAGGRIDTTDLTSRPDVEDTAQQNDQNSARFQDQHDTAGGQPPQSVPTREGIGHTGSAETPSTAAAPDSGGARTTEPPSSTGTESTPLHEAGRHETDTADSPRQDRANTPEPPRNTVSEHTSSDARPHEGTEPSTQQAESTGPPSEQSSRTTTHAPDETAPTGAHRTPAPERGADSTARPEVGANTPRNTTEPGPTPAVAPQGGITSSTPGSTTGGSGTNTGSTTPGRPDTADRTAGPPSRTSPASEQPPAGATTPAPSRTELDSTPVNTTSASSAEATAAPHSTDSDPNAEITHPVDTGQTTTQGTPPENRAESPSTAAPPVDRNGPTSPWNNTGQRGHTAPSSTGHSELTAPARSTSPNDDTPPKVRTESSTAPNRSGTARSTGGPHTYSPPARSAPEAGTTRQVPVDTTGDPNRTSESAGKDGGREVADGDSATTRPAPTMESNLRAEVLHGLLFTTPVDSGAVLHELHQLRGDQAAIQALQESFRARTGGLDLWMPLALNLDQPSYSRAMDLLGLPRDYVTGPVQPGAPSTSAPPKMGYDPAYNQSVWNFAGHLVQHNSTGRFDDAMTLLHGVGRDIRALWAIQDAYRMQTGSELSSDLMSTAPWRSHEVLHAMGAYSTDPVSMEQASHWHEQLKRSTFEHHARGRSTIRTDHPEDGCYIRAHLWALDLQRMGAAPSKIFVARLNPPLSVRTPYSAEALPGLAGQLNWNFHVAPSVIVNTPDGPKLHVLDPATNDGPVPFDSWLSNMQVDVASETTQILGGSPQHVQQVLDADFTSNPTGWGIAPSSALLPSGRAMVIASDPSALFFPEPWNPMLNPQSLQDADAQVRERYEDLLVQHNDTAQQRAENRARLENLLNNVGAIHQNDPGALSLTSSDPDSLSFDATNLAGTAASGTELFAPGAFASSSQHGPDALLNDPVLTALLNDTTSGFDPHAFNTSNLDPNEPGGNDPAPNGGGNSGEHDAPGPGSAPPDVPPSDGTVRPDALFAPDPSSSRTFTEWNEPRTSRDRSGGSGSRPAPLGIEDTGTSDRSAEATSREHDPSTSDNEPSPWDRAWKHSTTPTAAWFEPDTAPAHPDQWREQREHAPAHEVDTEVRDVRTNSTASELKYYEGRIRYALRHMDVAGQRVQEYTFRAHLSPGPTITPDQLRDLRDRLTETVDTLFNQGNRLPSGDQFHARVEFVDDPAQAHDTIHVSGEGPTDQNHWNIHASPNLHAHEIGHYFGLPDEYPDPRGPLDTPDTRRLFNRGDPPRATDVDTGDPHPAHNSVQLDNGLMGHSALHDPHLKPRHLWAIENTAHSQGARPDITPRTTTSPTSTDPTAPHLRPGRPTPASAGIELGELPPNPPRDSAPESTPTAERQRTTDGDRPQAPQHDTAQTNPRGETTPPTPRITLTKPDEPREQLVDLGNTPGYFQEGKALGHVALTELDTGGLTDRVRQLLPNPRALVPVGLDGIEPATKQNFESFMDAGRGFPVRVGTEWFEVRVRARPRLPEDLGPVASATPARTKVDLTAQSGTTNPRTNTVTNPTSTAFNATGGPLLGPYGSLGAGAPLATPSSSQHRDSSAQEQRNFRSGSSSTTAEVPVDFDIDVRDAAGRPVRAAGTADVPGTTTGSAELRIPDDLGRMNRHPEVGAKTPTEGWGARLEHPGTEAVVDLEDGFDAIAGQLHPSITRLGAPGRTVLQEFLSATNLRNSMGQLQHGWVTSPDLLSPHGSRGTAVQMRASFGRAELVGTSGDTTMRLHESSATSSSTSATSKTGFEVDAGLGGRAFGLGTMGGAAGVTGGYKSSRSSNSVTGVESTSRPGMQVKGNQGLYKVDTTIEVRTPNGRSTSFTATSYLRAGLPEAADQGLPVPPGTRNSITTATEQRFPPPFLADKAAAGDVKVGEHGPVNRVRPEIEQALGRIKGFEEFLPDWSSRRTTRETGKHLSDEQERFDNLRKLDAELSPSALRTKLDSLLGPGVQVQLKKRDLFTSDYVNIAVKARLGTPEHLGQADQRNIRSIAAGSAKWENSTGVEKGWSAGVEGRLRLVPDTGVTRSVLSPTVGVKYSDTTAHKMSANPTVSHQSLLVGDSKSQLFRYPVEFDVEISSYSRTRSWVKRTTPGSPAREVPEPKVLARTAAPDRPAEPGVVEIPALRDPMTLWMPDSATSSHDLAEFRPGPPRTRELGDADPSNIRELLSNRNRPEAPNWLHVEAVAHTEGLRDEAIRLLDRAADGDGALGLPGSVSRDVLDRFFSPENVKAELRQLVDHGLVEDGLVHSRRVHDRRGGVAMGFALSHPRLVSASEGLSTENNDVGGFKAGASTTRRTGWELNTSFTGTARPSSTPADPTSGLGGGALSGKPWSRTTSETHGAEISGSLERNVITPANARTMLVQLDAEVTLQAESHERNMLHNGTPRAEGSVTTLPGGVFLRVSEEQARALGVLDEPATAPTHRQERLDAPSTISRGQPSSLGLSAVDDVPDLTRLIDEMREKLGPEGAKLLPESALNDSMRNLRQLAGLTSRENVTALLDTTLDGGVPLLVHRPGVFGRDSYQVMLNAELGDPEFVDVVNDGVGVDHTLARSAKETGANSRGHAWNAGVSALGGITPGTGDPKLSTTAGTGLGAGTNVGHGHSTTRTESSSRQVGYTRKASGPMARYEVPVRFELTVLRDGREPTTVSLDEQRLRMRLLADNQSTSTDGEPGRSGGYAPKQRVVGPQEAREQELRTWQRNNPTIPKTAAPEGMRGVGALREAAVEALRRAGAGKGLTTDGTGALHTLRSTLSSEVLQPHLPDMLDGPLTVPKLHETALLTNRHAEVKIYARVHTPRLVALSDGLEMANPRADSTTNTAETKHEETGSSSVAPGQGRALWNNDPGGLLNSRGADLKRDAAADDTSTGGTAGGRTSAVKPDERSGLVEYDVEYRVVGEVDGTTGVVDLAIPASTQLRVSEPDLPGLLGRDLPEQLSQAQNTLTSKADAWRKAEIAADKARRKSVEQLNEIAPRRAEAERALTERRSELDRAEQRVRTLEQQVDQARTNQQTARSRLEELRDGPRVAEADRQADAAVNRLWPASSQRAELAEEVEQLRSRQPHEAERLADAERELRDAADHERAAEAEYARSDAGRQRMQDEVRHAQDQLTHATETLYTAQHRLDEAIANRDRARDGVLGSDSTVRATGDEVSTVERELERARDQAHDAQSEWWAAKATADRELAGFRAAAETAPRGGLDLPRDPDHQREAEAERSTPPAAPTRPAPWNAPGEHNPDPTPHTGPAPRRTTHLPPVPEETELESLRGRPDPERATPNSTAENTTHAGAEHQREPASFTDEVLAEFDRMHTATEDRPPTPRTTAEPPEAPGASTADSAPEVPRDDTADSSHEPPLDRLRADRPTVADLDGTSVRASVLELLTGNRRLRQHPNLREFVEVAFSDENLRKHFHRAADGGYEVDLGTRAGGRGARITLDIAELRAATPNEARGGTAELTSSRTHDTARNSSTTKRSPLGTGGLGLRVPWLYLLAQIQVAGLVNSRDSDLTARHGHEETTTLTEHHRPGRTARHETDYRITVRTPGRFPRSDEVTQHAAADATAHLTWPEDTTHAGDTPPEPWQYPGEITHAELSGLGAVHRAISGELGLRIGDPAGRELRDWLHSLGAEVLQGPVRKTFSFDGRRAPIEIVLGVAEHAHTRPLPDVEGTVTHTTTDEADSTSGQATTRQRGGTLWVAGGDISGLTGALAGPAVSHVRSTRDEHTHTAGHERATTSDHRGRLHKQRVALRYLVRLGDEQREVPPDEPTRNGERGTAPGIDPPAPEAVSRYAPKRLLHVDGAATVWTRGTTETPPQQEATADEPPAPAHPEGTTANTAGPPDRDHTTAPPEAEQHRIPDRLDAHHQLEEHAVQAITGPVLSKLHADGTLPGKALPELAARLNSIVRAHPREVTGGDGLRLPLGTMHPGAPDVFVRGTLDRTGARYLGRPHGTSTTSTIGNHETHRLTREHGRSTTAGINAIAPASIPNPVGPAQHNSYSGLQTSREVSHGHEETTSHTTGYSRTTDHAPVHEFSYPTEFEVRIGGRWSDQPDPAGTSTIHSHVRISAPERAQTRLDDAPADSPTTRGNDANDDTGTWQRGHPPRPHRQGHLPADFELDSLAPAPGLRRTVATMLGTVAGTRWTNWAVAPLLGRKPTAFDEHSTALDAVESFTGPDARTARFERAALHRDTAWLKSHNPGGPLGNRELTARADLSTRLETPRVVARDDAHSFGGSHERAERGAQSTSKHSRSYRLGGDLTQYFASGNPAAMLGPTSEFGVSYTSGNATASKSDSAKSTSAHRHTERGYLVRYDAVHEVRTSARRSWQDPLRLLHHGPPDERSEWVRVPDAVEAWVPAAELHQVGRLPESDIARLAPEDAEHYRRHAPEPADPESGDQQHPEPDPAPQPPRDHDGSAHAAEQETSAVRPPENAGRGSGRIELYRPGAARELLEQVQQRLSGWSRQHGRPGAGARMLDLAYEALGKPPTPQQPSVPKFDAINERLVDGVLGQLGSRYGFDTALEEMLNGGRPVHLTGDTPFGKVEQLVVLRARPGAGRYQRTLSEHTTTDSHETSRTTGHGDQRGWDVNAMLGASPFYGTSNAPGSVHMHGLTGAYGSKRGFEGSARNGHSTTADGAEPAVQFLHDLTIDMEVYPYSRPGAYSGLLGGRFARLAPRRFGQPWRSSFDLRAAARSTIPTSEVLPLDGPTPPPLARADGPFRRERDEQADRPAWPPEAKIRVRPFAAPALHDELGKLAHGDPELEPPRPDLRPGNAARLHTATGVGQLRSHLPEALSPGGHTVELAGGQLESVRITADLSSRELLGEVKQGSLTSTDTEQQQVRSTSQRGGKAAVMTSMDFRQPGLEGAPLRPGQGLVSINRTVGDRSTDEAPEVSTTEESPGTAKKTRYLVRVTPEWELTPSYRGTVPPEWEAPLRTGPDEPVLLEVDGDGLTRLGLSEPAQQEPPETAPEPGHHRPDSTSSADEHAPDRPHGDDPPSAPEPPPARSELEHFLAPKPASGDADAP
ncbi:protein-glutamine glutaminase family protein [Actinopolyspora saharensis]|uniref:Uncharacterized protein n=1 Tax=Actinopolyspora saharensis TaxID=995062 RepID=A0A1H0YQF8_9ACTN|nr:protein-glutamine glutaminase family protein [Actinopolyspora saharensis]SDQ17462.1 hypothetical protein SAMN04489718_0615 [Actinopolyspora saharensis]